MIELLGNHFGKAKLDLKDVAPVARASRRPDPRRCRGRLPHRSKPVHSARRRPGRVQRRQDHPWSSRRRLLVGRRDLVRAAWANSAPHHAFGRALKVTKEEVIGMLRAVEAWRTDRDLAADFRTWESWYAHISDRITKVAGVRTEVKGPVRGGPFPVLNILWDPAKVGLTAGEVGRLLLDGEPRIMTQAEGEGHSFLLRPVAMKPGEYKIVARRLYEVLLVRPE